MAHLQTCFVSTFPPRKCGLATFTEDLVEATAELGVGPEPWVVAVTHADRPLKYDRRVRFEIRQEDEASYKEAARWLNAAPVDVVMIEHEYGIFGGEYGSYVLTLLENLRKPALVTLHTVLPEPRQEQADIMRGLASYGAGMVSLAEKGRDILRQRYGLPGEKIHVIRHGVPPAPKEQPAVLKKKYGLVGREVISTFGLLHPGKGIEYVLKALPDVVAQHPETIYLVLGQTHPEVQKRYGEAYLESLQGQVKRLGLKDNVSFVNRYLSQNPRSQSWSFPIPPIPSPQTREHVLCRRKRQLSFRRGHTYHRARPNRYHRARHTASHHRPYRYHRIRSFHPTGGGRS
jgi:glycosyltransferase involved in cell wall biosynthesis